MDQFGEPFEEFFDGYPTKKQINFAFNIANVLGIEPPLTYTKSAYFNFISTHIEEFKSEMRRIHAKFRIQRYHDYYFSDDDDLSYMSESDYIGHIPGDI